jgi:hypothetical protein
LRDGRETAANDNGGAGLLFSFYFENVSWHSFTEAEQRIISKTAQAFARAPREESFLLREGEGADPGEFLAGDIRFFPFQHASINHLFDGQGRCHLARPYISWASRGIFCRVLWKRLFDTRISFAI